MTESFETAIPASEIKKVLKARQMPNAEESEIGILACMVIAPNEVIPDCIQRFDGMEVFYTLKYDCVYREMIRMWDERVPIESIALQQRLGNAGFLDGVGGMEFIMSLPDRVPSAGNFGYYADQVFENYQLRQLIRACDEISERVFKREGSPQELIERAEVQIMNVASMEHSKSHPTTRQLVQQAIDQIELYHGNQGKLMGLSTGYTDLDKLTDGMHGGEMIVIAARPSLGKTSIAMNIVEHVAVDAGIPVGVFSLEMQASALMLRMICSKARVNLRNVRDGFMADRDFPRIVAASGKINKAPLFVDDTGGLSIMQLRAKARRMHQQHGIKLFVIDYLQLLHSTAIKGKDNREREIADISGGIKSLAKELDVPVIVLAQLNRSIEKDKNRKPRLSDLRESGAIEQDADVVGMLYKPAGEDDDMPMDSNDGIPINLLVAKQRNGDTGDVRLVFLKSFTRFESAAKINQTDIPEYPNSKPRKQQTNYTE